jgi:hypothetical protein
VPVGGVVDDGNLGHGERSLEQVDSFGFYGVFAFSFRPEGSWNWNIFESFGMFGKTALAGGAGLTCDESAFESESLGILSVKTADVRR